MTAYSLAVMGEGTSEADQKGLFVEDDTEVFRISHPPWINICRRGKEMESLSPPRQLSEDWNRNVAELGPYETWEEINYEKKYYEHIEFSPAAEKALRKLRMLCKARDVCIVCGDPYYELCPRRLIYERVQEQLGREKAKVTTFSDEHTIGPS